MKIQLKRSNVLEGGNAKQPTAGQMEYGELAVNYNENDPAIFIKDSNNQIIRVAGAGYDYNDLDNIPTIGDGEITIEDADGAEVGSFTVNQTGDATITLPAATVPGDGEITIEQNSVVLGTFTVNQTGDTTITLPDTATISPPSVDEPANPSNGDIWIDSNECPPVLKIWSDCDGTGQWYELTSSAPKPIQPDPGDITSPSLPGSGTQVDPYILTSKTTTFGSDIQTDETITISNQQIGELVQFTDENAATNGARFAQQTGIVGADGTWKGKLDFDDSVDTSTSETTFTGLLKIGTIYFQWAVSVEPALNLTVGKGVITPNVDVEVGDTLTGSATLVDAVNPVITHEWEEGGVVQSQNSATYVPKAAGNVRYRQKVTDDNNQSAVEGPWSDAVTVSLPPGPTATMSGLRFDALRKTKLVRALNNDGNSKVFTWSGWIKNVGAGDNQQVIFSAYGTTGNAYTSLDFRNKCLRFLKWNGGGVDFEVKTESTFNDASKWIHVVLVVDTTQDLESNRVKLYVNGVEPELQTTTYPAQNSELDISSARLHALGHNANGTSGAEMEGYLSEVYFVDGKAAQTTTFGKFFPGDKWGPLDNSVIENNLNNLQPADPTPEPGPGEAGQPYDSRANTDQVWSNSAVSNGLEPWTKAFDGVTNSTFNANEATSNNDGTPVTWSYSADDLTFTKIEVWACRDVKSPSEAGVLTINGKDVSGQLTDNTHGWYELDLTGATTEDKLKTIGLAGYAQGNMRLGGIKLDGRLLVDNGLWDNSQNWSDNLSAAAGIDNVTRAFNGNVNSYTTTKDFGDTLIYEQTFENVTKVRAHSFSCDLKATLGGTDYSGNTAEAGWVDLYDGSPSTLTKITATGNNTSSDGKLKKGQFSAIEVNGKLLVDSGAQWDTSRVWSSGLSAGADFQNPAVNAFDGDDTTEAYSSANDDTLTMIFDPPVTGELEIIISNGGIFKDLGGSTIGTLASDIWSYTASNFTGFTIAQNGGRPNPKLMRLGGKVLVDGTATWDTSQRWSDGWTGKTQTSYGPEKSFDGNFISGTNSTTMPLSEQDGGTGILEWTGNIDTSAGNVILYYWNQSNSPDTEHYIEINNQKLSLDTVGPNSTAKLSLDISTQAGSAITSMKIGRKWGNSNATGISGISVNGTVIVDAAYTWNTTQVWSDGVTTPMNTSLPATRAFDGDPATYAESTTGLLEVSSSAFTNGSYEVEIKSSGNSTSITCNGGALTHQGSSIWKGTVTNPFPLAIAHAQNPDLYYVKVNGKILVDSGFGANGFYLPFDPAATGANYGNSITRSGAGTVVAGTSESMFNGELLSGGLIVSTGTITETFGTPLPTGNYEPVLAINGGIENVVFNLQDSSTVTWTITDAPGGITAGSPAIYASKEVSSPVVSITRTAVSGVGIKSFIVDGAQLVDHNSIGVDASGQDNHFHDDNFAVGNTDEIWSAGGTLSNSSWITQLQYRKLFNGSIEDSSQSNQGFEPTVTFNNGFIGNGTTDTVELYFRGNLTSTTINGVARTVTLYSWWPVPENKLTSLQWKHPGSGQILNPSAVRVNGEILVDKDVVDTVLDTPMKNYAVLTNGSNGNLTSSSIAGNLTESTISVGSDKVYFESTWLSGTTHSISFDKAATVELKSDGVLRTGIDWTNATAPSYNVGDTVAVAMDGSTGVFDFYINGVKFDTGTLNPTLSEINIYSTQPSTTMTNNYGQIPYVYTPPAGYGGLYQEWSEYARSTLGYALDRIAKLEALLLSDAETIAELRSQIENALSRIASIESDEVNDDAVDNSLITLVGSLSSQITAWTERIETAETNLSALTSRVTTLES